MTKKQAPFVKTKPQEQEPDELERNVPSELRSRPKIPRTPAEGELRQLGRRDQDVPQGHEEDIVKIKGEPVKDETKLKEH